MKKQSLNLVLGLVMSVGAATGIAGELEKGKIIPSVICAGQVEQSYALYLPTAYTPDQAWPIIYCLDPGARGSNPVELFQGAAEKYGYILAGSNNSQNGPMQTAATAVAAVWQDTHARFKLNPGRVYTVGFSGAGQVALAFCEIVKQPIAGVVVNSSGLLSIQPVEKFPKRTAVYLVTGDQDFNYQVTRGLAQALSSNGVANTFLVFPGVHRWMPVQLATAAVEWFELQAMKDGRKGRDEGLIGELLAGRRTQFGELEQSGSIVDIVNGYERAVADFTSFIDLKDMREKLDGLVASERYKAARDEESACQKSEQAQEAKIVQLVSRFAASEDEVEGWKLVTAMDIAALTKNTKSTTACVAHSAIRLLVGFSQRTSSLAFEAEARGDISRATALFDLASRFAPERFQPWYNLARMHAKKGREKAALVALQKAVECGLDNPEYLENDADLQRLRENAKYVELLQRMRNRRQPTK